MQLFNQIEILGAPRTWRNFTVWGLRANAGPELSYGLASTNLARGKLKIVETGVVGEVELHSSSGRYTLVPEGTRLIGGRQDRVVNTSVLIPPQAKVRVQVSCVEANRWHARKGVDATQFSIADSLASPTQRSVLKKTTGDGHSADQQSVWESVDCTVTNLGAGLGNGTLSQAYEAVREAEVEATQALAYVEGANGIAIAIGAKVRTVEFFNNPRKLAHSWSRIVGSHLVEVDPRTQAKAETLTEEQLEETIAVFRSSNWQSVRPAAAGMESRATIDSSHASVLTIEDSVVHASVVFV